MPPSRRSVLAAVGVAVGTGCPRRDVASPPASPESTVDPPSTATGADPPTGDCETATPRPVPDVTLTNDASEAVTLTVTVRRASGDTASPPVYEATHSLAPGGAAEAHDVLPASDAYRVTVDVAGGTTETATVEAAPTRYGAVSIRVERTDAATVGWLDVVPPPTPTACP